MGLSFPAAKHLVTPDRSFHWLILRVLLRGLTLSFSFFLLLELLHIILLRLDSCVLTQDCLTPELCLTENQNCGALSSDPPSLAVSTLSELYLEDQYFVLYLSME